MATSSIKGKNITKIEPFEKYTKLYEDWFEENRYAYESELKAVQALLPSYQNGVEIGVGSGRFAVPLGIKRGLEPSVAMGKIAEKRGIVLDEGVCENLPYKDSQFDLVLMITTICFLDDAEKSFQEVKRILRPGGWFIIGYIDKNSIIGKSYLKFQDSNVFYRVATFYSTEEIIQLLNKTGFMNFKFSQTIFHELNDIKTIEPVKEGYGTGSFVAVRAQK